MYTKYVFIFILKLQVVLHSIIAIKAQEAEIKQIFGRCHKKSEQFDDCIKYGFNDVRIFFKTGVPNLGIAPFDPHRAKFVEQQRGLPNGNVGGYNLVLSDVSELGWINSNVTAYKTDSQNNRFIYSQDFPEKSLNGKYNFQAKMLGKAIHYSGIWNMTLYNYAQTTTVTRIGGPGGLLKVRVEIDKLGDLKLKITGLFNGNESLGKAADFLIASAWQLGFPFVKPLINDLVSTAFTDIFNESFRNFPIDDYILD